MAQRPEIEVLQEFHDRVQREEVGPVTVTYRQSGGIPGRAREATTLTIDSTGHCIVRSDRPGRSSERSASLGVDEAQSLFDSIRNGLGGMTPRSEAKFLPDSRLASVTIEIEGRQADWTILANDVDRQVQRKPVPAETEAVIARLAALAESLRGEGGELE